MRRGEFGRRHHPDGRLMLQHSIARPLLIPALSALDYPIDAPRLIGEQGGNRVVMMV